tara:strand:- start:1150 stop:2376 length:1227 start_codon:yes stop_codon:yes gene_type:complete
MRHNSALIIDDDPLLLTIVEAFLLDAGLQCVELAEDGEVAMARIAEAPDKFDLIICDLNMPNLDGVGVIRALARMKYPGKVIIFSGEDGDLIRTVHNMSKMLSVHIAGTMQKPIDPVRMKALLESHQVATSESSSILSQSQLAEALEHGRLRPYYQPKIDLRTHSVSGFEVLCRHIAPDGSESGPVDYIRAAMVHSMIGQLTRAMIDQAINDVRDWERQIGPFGLAINMSPVCILNPALPDKLLHKFTSAGIDPRSITFEITEDRLLDNQVDTLEVLSRLRLGGFKLSLDDFGTGAASIEQLRNFPFTELKIDRKFVMAAQEDAFAQLAVETGLRFADTLGIKSVAEGVETSDALRFVTDAGAHEAQGFYFSKALSPAEAPEWARRFNADPVRFMAAGSSSSDHRSAA